MNVRVFLLIAMTAFFGVLWSSDHAYQVTQMAAAEAARRQPVCREPVVARRPLIATAVASEPARLRSGRTLLVVSALLGPAVTPGVVGVVQWTKKINARMEEEWCAFRFRARKALFFAQRRAAVMIRQQKNWREIAARLGRDAFRRLEVTKSAAVPTTIQTR